MHVPDGFLNLPTSAATAVAAVSVLPDHPQDQVALRGGPAPSWTTGPHRWPGWWPPLSLPLR